MSRMCPPSLTLSCRQSTMGPSHKTVAPARICVGPIKINIIMLRHDKTCRQCGIRIASETTPKIGNNNIKPKQ